MIGAIIAVVVYTLFVGSGLLSSRIPAERAYLLIAAPCVVPALWYLYGFLRADDKDYGLVLSAIGWFLAALTLLEKHLATGAALDKGMSLSQVPDSAASVLFSLLSVAAIVGGAVLSGRYWMDKNSS